MKSFGLMVFAACWVAAQQSQMTQIRHCEARCSQGLRCRNKPQFMFDPCRKTPESLISPIFHNISIGTVMKCEKKQQCSLHLKVSSAMQISEHVRGVSFCTTAVGMLQQCKDLLFPREARNKFSGQQVEVQSDCFEVRPDQDVHVTLQTVPNFCDLTWSRRHHVQGCNNEDLRNNLTECITGRIAYTIDTERKQLSVMVTEMLEGEDYDVRLCHRGYTCRGTGAHVLIKKENPLKTATFHYSRPLPCLCIEGWSHVVDAPRVQVCPFKNRTEELWNGVTFDLDEGVLSWESPCSVEAVVTLCHAIEEHSCLDLANSTQAVNSGKVTFPGLDPHPELCIKFTTIEGSWIKCPFAGGKFSVWDLSVTSIAGLHQAIFTSQTRASLTLNLCHTSGSFKCQEIASVTMERLKEVSINLTMEVCGPGICVQARRVDVQFSVSVIKCHLPCEGAHSVPVRHACWHTEKVVVLAAVCLTGLVTVALLANIMLTVYQKWRPRKQCGSPDPFDLKAAFHPVARATL